MANKFKMEQSASLQSINNYTQSELLRKQGIYVWAFPITYPDKITFGWEYELPDGRTSWYNEEENSYEDAMEAGIKAVKELTNPPK